MGWHFFPLFIQHNTRGVVSMASSGPDTNGSQFFIIYSKQPHLDMKYTVIGKLVDLQLTIMQHLIILLGPVPSSHPHTHTNYVDLLCSIL